jgi:hypothetical protein
LCRRTQKVNRISPNYVFDRLVQTDETASISSKYECKNKGANPFLIKRKCLKGGAGPPVFIHPRLTTSKTDPSARLISAVMGI